MISKACPCGGIARDGVCDRCSRKGGHESTTKRGYDGKWKRFRKRFLIENPLCVDCQKAGKATPARELHHIIKIRHNPSLRLEPSNIMPLCPSCHSLRTARGE